MPAKTIYISEENLPLFERAEELGKDSLSAVIAEAVKRFVEAKEAEGKGLEEHILEVGLFRSQGADDTKKVKFIGRLLAEGTKYSGQTSSGDDRGTIYRIYKTRAGRIIVHWMEWTRWQGESSFADYAALTGLPDHGEQVAGEEDVTTIPGSILEEAAEALGEEKIEIID